MKAIGIDGGLAHMGWAIGEVGDGRVDVLRAGVIVTQRDETENASDDNHRRAREVWRALRRLVIDHDPSVVFIEAMSYPKNVRGAAMLSMSLGVVACVAESWDIPVFQGTPMQLKEKLTGLRTAGKDLVIARAKAAHPQLAWPALSAQHEHQADAIAALHWGSRHAVAQRLLF